jgi:hypothetical protein
MHQCKAFHCLCSGCAGQRDESTVEIRHHAVACVTQRHIAASVVTVRVHFVRMEDSVGSARTSDLQIWITVANTLKVKFLYLIWLKFSKSTGFVHLESSYVQNNFYKILKFSIKKY